MIYFQLDQYLQTANPTISEVNDLTTDAGAFAMDAELLQSLIRKYLLVGYASRTICSVESRY